MAFDDWWQYLTEPLPGDPTSAAGQAVPLVGPSRQLGASLAAGRYDRASVYAGLAILDAVGVGEAFKLGGGILRWAAAREAALAAPGKLNVLDELPFLDSQMAMGRRSGVIIDPADLQKITAAQQKRGVRVAVDEKGFVVSDKEPAKFRVFVSDQIEPSIFLKPDVTWYEYIHEYYHSTHYRAVGKQTFRGLSGLKREQHVFDKLISSPYWKRFSPEERAHAVKYIDSLGGNTRGVTP